MREHRLYQADFLLRSYGYSANELLEGPGHLALDIDPKLAWALEHREVFPLDLNRAEPALIARIPGIGLRTTQRLVELRRQRRIRYEDLARMRCVLAKAKPFIITSDYHPQQADSHQRCFARAIARPPAAAANGAVGMISLDCDDLFSTWRQQARWLLSHQIDPSQVSWGVAEGGRPVCQRCADARRARPVPGAHPHAHCWSCWRRPPVLRRSALEPVVRSAVAGQSWRPHGDAGGRQTGQRVAAADQAGQPRSASPACVRAVYRIAGAGSSAALPRIRGLA